MMKKTTTVRTTVIVLILVMMVVGYYAYLSNKSRENRQEATLSVVQSALSRDLNKNYPPTPKEAVKYYNELLKCLYNEENNEEERLALGRKMRELYDTELQNFNEEETSLLRLEAEVTDFKKKQRRIAGINLAASTDVEFFEEDGYEFARLRCGYNMTQEGKSYLSEVMYLLRKDENRRWKIYGWENVENLENDG